MRKTVFITGAGSGLGKEAAIALARRGHKVIATTHYKNQLTDLLEIAGKEKLDLISFKLDILRKEDRNLALNYDIDVFIANAAIGNSGSVAEVYVEKIEEVFETNIFANLEFIQLMIKNMIRENKNGRIVFLSSLAGRIPMPFLSPYCASKAAIEVFATCLREELKLIKNPKIEVGVIEPGAFATGYNKENNSKKYDWMEKGSYFKNELYKIKYYEKKIWNFIEIKPFNSIIKKYIKTVEDKKLKHRYSAPWYQTGLVQLGRILGM